MSGLGHYARNVGMLVGQSFVQRVLGMVTTIILARILGASGYGVYGVVSATSTSIYGLSRLGIDAALHVTTAEGYSGTEGRRRMEELLGAGLVLLALGGALGGLACLAISETIADHLFDRPDLEIWIRIAGVAVVLQSLSQFCYATLAGLHRFAEYALVMLASAVMNLIAISLGALIADVGGAVGGLIAAQAATTLGLTLATRHSLGREALSLSFAQLARRAATLMKFGVPYYVAGTIAIPGAYVAQGLVVRHAGLEAAGYLRVVIAITTIVSFVPTSAAAAMISMFARTRTQSAEEFACRIMLNFRLIFVFAVTTAICLAAALPWLVPVVFGRDFGAAIGPASIGLLTAVLASCYGIVTNALLSSRRVFSMGTLSLFQASLFILLAVLLIPDLGLTGFLLAELAGYAFALLVALIAGASWFRASGVSFGWMGWAMAPLGVLAVNAVRTLSADAIPSPGEVTARIAVVLLTLASTYALVLTKEERALLRPAALLGWAVRRRQS
ncbi:lipopolysaccharide biosynthesis protein [Amorphus coralli]|uniref:lipopolysaccharide biosynthesis protein n=1 Tax=Amorphus coralli TaxID=340680 RepID=UPI00058ED3C6|nr:oligosaccharide flippase family protein [Amorphus coralli]